MRLTADERALLQRLSKEQLVFLSQISADNDVEVLIRIVTHFIDIEKNKFFGTMEISNETLAIDHAFSRGKAAGLTQFLHIIGGAKGELARRDKK